MANPGAVRAGRAFVELFADDSKLVRGLNAAAGKLKSWGSSIASLGAQTLAVGAAITTPFIAASKVFSDMGGAITDMSQRTGASVESLSALGYAAEQSGTSMESVEKSLRKMQRNLVEAGAGSKSANEALSALGLTSANLAGLSPDEQFLAIGDAISEITDPAQRAAAAMEIFGKSGAELLPLFSSGAAGVQDLMQEAANLGLVLDTEGAASAEAFGDETDKLFKVLKQTAYEIGATVAPSITEFAQSITSGIVAINNWVKENKDLIATAFKIGAAIAAAGVALLAIGAAVGAIGSILAGIATAIGAVGAAIGFLLSPIGLVIAGLSALAAWFFTSTEAGGDAVDWLVGKWSELKDEAMAAFGGIADAIAAGDLALAFRVLWSLIKVEFTKGVAFLEEIWQGFRGFFVETFVAAQFGLSRALVSAWAGLQAIWVTVTSSLSGAWSSFCGFASELWTDTQELVSDGWLELQGLMDDTVDVAGEKAKRADAERQREGAAAEQAAQETRAREADKNKRLGQITQDEKGTLDTLGSQQQREKDARAADRQSKIDAANSEVDSAKKEFQDALGAAKAAREKSDQEKAAKPKIGKFNGRDLDEDLTNQATQTQGPKTVGTFSAAVAANLGGGGIEDQQLVEQKKHNELLAKAVTAFSKGWENLRFGLS